MQTQNLLQSWQYYRQLLVTTIIVSGAIAVSINSASAQIIPDTTLGSESSVVTPNITINGVVSDRIDGGAIRNINLFHSLQEFNINSGRGAYFTNPAGIENIFSRITGNNPSNIFGKLGVLGNANLFLINPKGIIFGSTASLDIKGSFLATTANAIQFGEQGSFSASNPNIPANIIVHPSALLFNQINAQSITNQGNLIVPTGKSLLLVGGNLNLNGGKLQAPAGQIQLGGLLGIGSVGLNVTGSNLTLTFPENISLANISLINKAVVDANGSGGGNIQVRGQQVSLQNQSQIVAETLGNTNGIGINIQASQLNLQNGSKISTSTSGSGRGGFLNINASESLKLDGAAGANVSGLFAEVQATGQGGSLTVNTSNLTITNGGSISTSISRTGTGQGGDLTVNAKSVEMTGESPNNSESNLITRNRGSGGNAGKLTVNTENLRLSNGAEISATTYSRGNGGTIIVNASNSIEATGVFSDRSGIFAGVSTGATGRGGDIIINTKNLSIRDGASASVSVSAGGRGQGGSLTVNADSIEISGEYENNSFLDSNLAARTRGSGNAGQLTINTRKLILDDGGNVSASTFNAGNAGTLIINASESIEAIGGGEDRSGIFARSNSPATGKGGDITINTGNLIVRDGASVSSSTTGKGNGGNLNINARDIEVTGYGNLEVGLRYSNLSALTSGSGNAGNLTINTENLTVANGAAILVNGEASGNAGNLQLVAKSVLLETGKITASTASGEGGNIEIAAENLQLRHNSQISATAGNRGNGGNIEINVNTLVALENSDITANAFQGRGGNIQITAQGIFLSPDSEITASSEKGINGVVEVRTFGLDFKNSLTTLTANFVNTDRVVAGSCLANRNREQGSFTVTGTEALPPTPYDRTSGRYSLSQVRPLETSSSADSTLTTAEKAQPWKLGDPIVEAKGIAILNNGRKVLKISPADAIASAPKLICHSEEQS